jgi:hypothetical protein
MCSQRSPTTSPMRRPVAATNLTRSLHSSGVASMSAASSSPREDTNSVSAQQVSIRQRGEAGYEIRSTTRAIDAAEGGYLWRGELRLWDNEILTGWYVADEAAVRAKGTLYFVLQPDGTHMRGRWVGLGADGAIQTGVGALARTEREARRLVESQTSGGRR